MRARFPAFHIIILSFIFIVAGVCPGARRSPCHRDGRRPACYRRIPAPRDHEPPVISLPPLLGEKQIIDVLDLKNMDILDVLKLISQKSGLNIIAGQDVRGRITVF